MIFPLKASTKMTVPIIGTNTQGEVTADELLNSREKEWREFTGEMLSRVPAAGQEQSWGQSWAF